MLQDVPALATLRVSVGQYSSAGQKAENQDFHGAILPTGQALALKGVTLAVADGISSSKVSGEAAETAVKALLSDYYATPDSWTTKTAALRVIASTNAWLHGQNIAVTDINAGRVCTLSALIIKSRMAHILHVGDSRVWRLSGTSLEPLTSDHRVTLSATESYLGRALGVDSIVEIDYFQLPVSVGDVFVLTTDGMHDHLSGTLLAAALQRYGVDDVAQTMVEAAEDAGSTDNLTVQILRVEALPDARAGPAIETAQLPVPPLAGAGDRIDGFTIQRELHATARSHVYLATDPTGQPVALKIPATEMAQDVDYLNRFVLEGWIARRISSPHVVRAGRMPDKPTALFAVTEMVEGTTLRQWMTDNPTPDLEAVRDIAHQIAAGLRAFHRREMVHQDLRPENVMIDGNGTVKIIDLGSTAVAGVEEAQTGLLGQLPGTYQYTAPEFFSGDPVSWRSDQYALGVLLYEMLSGRLPYGAQVARIRTRRDQARLSYRSVRDDDSTVPAWVDIALQRATHPDPLRRYDALTEFVADLRRPGSTWSKTRHVPLAQRDPVHFWQSVSAILAVLCLFLAVRLSG